MADTQNIEAKLAAYVDGDIDPAERAEIEEHLAANPQHRQMIEELKAQSQLLRALPRQDAPADVAEALAQQLERAALLGDVDIGAVGSDSGLNRWSSWGAIAAVVAMTIGLGMVVYFVLPSPQAPKPTIALITPETTDSRREATLDAADRDVDASESRMRRAGKEANKDVAKGLADRQNEDLSIARKSDAGAEPPRENAGEAKDKFAAKSEPSPLEDRTPTAPGAPATAAPMDSVATNGGAGANQLPGGGRGFGGGGAGAGATLGGAVAPGAEGYNLLPPSNAAAVYVIVKCPDPQAATSRVAEVLASCNLAYQHVPDPTRQTSFAMVPPPAPNSVNETTATNRADFESGRRGGDRIAMGKRGYDSIDAGTRARPAEGPATAPATDANSTTTVTNSSTTDGAVAQSELAARGTISNANIGTSEVLPRPSATAPARGATADTEIANGPAGTTQPTENVAVASATLQQQDAKQLGAKRELETDQRQQQELEQQQKQQAQSREPAQRAAQSQMYDQQSQTQQRVYQPQQAPTQAAQQSNVPAQNGYARSEPDSTRNQLQDAQGQLAQALPPAGQAGVAATGGGWIVVHNVPRRQAAELGAAFSQPELRQVAQVFGLDAAAVRKPAEEAAKPVTDSPVAATTTTNEADDALRAKLGTFHDGGEAQPASPTTTPSDDASAVQKKMGETVSADQKPSTAAVAAQVPSAANDAKYAEKLSKEGTSATTTTQPSSGIVTDADRVDMVIIVQADDERAQQINGAPSNLSPSLTPAQPSAAPATTAPTGPPATGFAPSTAPATGTP